MSMNRGSLGSAGKLAITTIPAPRQRPARSLRIPGLGRIVLTRDTGDVATFAREHFMTHFRLIHRDPGGVIQNVREGPGTVTNAGVNLMSYDYTWAGGATLKQANFHALGTGTTASASSDTWLQTIASNNVTNFSTAANSGITNGYMTGTQAIIANSTTTPWSPIYQNTATFACTGGAGIALTEWILAISNAANLTGTASATSSTTLTGTGFTTAGNGLQGWTVEALVGITVPVNTPTTVPMLQVLSNTATVLTGLDNIWASGTKSWLSIANQAVATPGNIAYTVFPTAWDHKVFSTVTVNSGDTIQVQYQLSINSGG
jgi:hypothetical protein